MKNPTNMRIGRTLPVEKKWRSVVAVAVLLCIALLGDARLFAATNVQAAVCRVANQQQTARSVGSGTLIARSEDGRRGLVLTCAHLFREGVGEVVVEFSNGSAHYAKLAEMDQQADLAALAIANPTSEPARVSFRLQQTAQLSACGYGPNGQYRCAVGPVAGYAASPGQQSVLIAEGVRSGDSGGGVFDETGRLVAVIWGEAQGVTYASFGQPLQQFVRKVLERRALVAYQCPSGGCPLQSRQGGNGWSAAVPQQPVRRNPSRLDARKKPTPAEGRWSQLQAEIERLQKEKQDRGNYVTRGDLSGFARIEAIERIESQGTQRHGLLLERIRNLAETKGASAGSLAGRAAVGLLGIAGPAGWAVVAASTAGGWLLGRYVKRRVIGARGRRANRFRGQRNSTD